MAIFYWILVCYDEGERRGGKDMTSSRTMDEGKRTRRLNTVKMYAFLISIIGFQLVNFVVFYVIVNANSLMMAFQWRETDGSLTWTLHSFEVMFSQFASGASEIRIALRNTFIYFGFGFIMLPISFTTSYFMYKKIWGHQAFRILFFLPSVLSGVVWSMIYKNIVGVNGPIAALYQQIHGLPEPPVFLADSKYALTTVLMYSFWLGIAGNFVIFSGTLTRIPESVIEAGKLDGVSWIRELWQIILPLMWPTIGTMILLQLSGIFTASGNILLLTGGAYNTNSISFLIFQQVYGVAETSNTYNYGSAVGMFFTLLTIPIVFVSRYFINRIEDVEY